MLSVHQSSRGLPSMLLIDDAGPPEHLYPAAVATLIEALGAGLRRPGAQTTISPGRERAHG
jgi:hypothetical protein